MRAGRVPALLLAVMAVMLACTSLSAHRRDEYLQAARLAVEPGRVELQLDLTPGIDVAEAIIGDLDRDRDGALSGYEQRAYVARVFDGLELRIDGQPVHADPIASTFPDLDAFRRGEGTIRLRSAAIVRRVSEGAHRLAFHNRHRPDVSVYLANALVPDGDRVAITAQRRDDAQRDLTIDYVVRHQRSVWLPASLMLAAASVLNYSVRASRRARRERAKRVERLAMSE